VRVFDVEVELDESDTQRLREGFRASVEFPVETIRNVISIPVSAITNRSGAPHVQIIGSAPIEHLHAAASLSDHLRHGWWDSCRFRDRSHRAAGS
jgi:hypothetical protein